MAGLPPARESRVLSIPCMGAVKQRGSSDPELLEEEECPGTQSTQRWQWLELGQGREKS